MGVQEQGPEFVERPGWGGAGWVVVAVLLLSVVLALHFGRQYTSFMVHVRNTLEEPAEPLPWQVGPVTPEGCVDEAMAWAASCRGIKTLCDMYVSHVVELCMAAHDRVAYCEQLRSRHITTDFGAVECQARGVRRHLDDHACGNAYRQIDTHCTRILGERAAREGQGDE